MAIDVKAIPTADGTQRSKGLRALEAVKILTAGMDESECSMVLKLLETAAAEIRSARQA